VAQAQQDYLQRTSTLWLGAMMDAVPAPIQPAKGDRRFAGEEWRKSSLHNFLKDSYLINTSIEDRAVSVSTTWW
jgi:polyhydroxyalkanoate synthase